MAYEQRTCRRCKGYGCEFCMDTGVYTSYIEDVVKEYNEVEKYWVASSSVMVIALKVIAVDELGVFFTLYDKDNKKGECVYGDDYINVAMGYNPNFKEVSFETFEDIISKL